MLKVIVRSKAAREIKITKQKPPAAGWARTKKIDPNGSIF
jgi:hypothetical protein